MLANSSISPEEFSLLIDFCCCADKIAIAVSGGADSMALLLLANNWARAKKIKLIALTVNHNLRKEAEDEAQQVRIWCNNLNIEQHILQWEYTEKPKTAIQEKARNTRYKLMTDFCIKNNISQLLIAHHLGDQVETFFFRLARGSGLIGLSVMAQKTTINSIEIIRPLLSIPKTRLLATLEEKRQSWIEDPSNHNQDYTRVRIRKQLSELKNKDVVFARVLELTNKFRKFRNSLEAYLDKQLANNSDLYIHNGYAILHKELYLSDELIAYIIKKLTVKEKQVRSEKIKKLHSSIIKLDFRKTTLSGLIFQKEKNGNIIIYRETLKKRIEKPI